VHDAREAGHAYLVIDGTLIPIDRLAADQPFYSGKHRKHGMNLQVISAPDGEILWISGACPASSTTPARPGSGASYASWVPPDWSPWPIRVTTAPSRSDPAPGKNKPQSQKQANRVHARLRSPGERAIVQLKT
jgi:DDE superfamily endonuclease